VKLSAEAMVVYRTCKWSAKSVVLLRSLASLAWLQRGAGGCGIAHHSTAARLRIWTPEQRGPLVAEQHHRKSLLPSCCTLRGELSRLPPARATGVRLPWGHGGGLSLYLKLCCAGKPCTSRRHFRTVAYSQTRSREHCKESAAADPYMRRK
jgi:hypothetical protein